MKRALLIMPTTTYRASDFFVAAERLGIEIAVGSNRCHILDTLGATPTHRDSLVLDFLEPERSAETIARYAKDKPLDAILAIEDQTAVLAALASRTIGLPHNDPEAMATAKDKLLLRQRLATARIPQAGFIVIPLAANPAEAAERAERSVGYPCVIKPRGLSGSRGVIRADDSERFEEAFHRIARILLDPEVRALGRDSATSVLVESFLPGREVALEALVTDGALEPIALFDKPDPLDGPFFEETIYVTPSRLSAATQEAIVRVAGGAATALGIRHGPVHAELRLREPANLPDPSSHPGGESAPFLIELAPRTIGGLCARTLSIGLGMSLEELILRHALGLERPADLMARVNRTSSGVMMLPIPRTGTLRAVDGLDEARQIPGIEDVVITTNIGHEIVALPEGKSYLGFAFARGQHPADTERSLRRAHHALSFTITPKLPTC